MHALIVLKLLMYAQNSQLKKTNATIVLEMQLVRPAFDFDGKHVVFEVEFELKTVVRIVDYKQYHQFDPAQPSAVC